jgi:PAS domain S-box-containing protein
MDGKLKILFVEDILRDAELNWREIEKNGIAFNKLLVDNRKDFLDGLKSFIPDIIISDYSLPQFDGMKALLLRNEIAPLTPFIIVTGSVNEEVAVECMKAGADDYVIKEHLTRLPFAVKDALEQKRIQAEKRASELLLREKEDKLQSIFSAAPVGIALVIDHVFTEVNDTLCKMTGYNRKELIGKNIEMIYAIDEQNESVGIILFKYIAEKGTGSVETRFICKDGSILNIFLSSSPLDKNDLAKGVTVTAMDITKIKKAEEALNESQQLFQTLAQMSPVGIFRTNPSGYITYLNPKYSELTGMSVKEAIFYSWLNAVHPDDRETLESNWLSDIQSQKTFNIEYRLIKSDKSIVWVIGNIVPEFFENGISGYIGTIIDITERKKAEDAIVHERSLLRILIDNLPDAIYIKDVYCRKVIANIADVKNIGFNNEKEVIGKTDIELFPGQIGRRGFDDDNRVINSGVAIVDREEDFFDSNGVRRWLLTTKIPIRDKEGKIAGLVGIGHDISERKLIELELISAKDKAEEGDRLKTAFLHNISHEIRTPMNAIVGFSALLGEPDVDVQTSRSYIGIIMQSCDHLLSIITDIVDISNIEANLVKINKNEIDLNSSLKSLLYQFLPRANKKKLALVFEADVNHNITTILTDGTKLIQIISNLISNALKFTDKGYVKFGYHVRNDKLEFFVTDTGIGIPQEHHKEIFERFFQVKNSDSRLYEGTGLGLSISKAYVDLMGGKIWLESEPGNGTTFYFTIPFERSYSALNAAIDKEPLKNQSLRDKKTVLIAEDDDSNFELLTYFLSGLNIEILRVVNGKEAVEKCLSVKNIDLVLMDIKMPVMNGYTATQLIREEIPEIPIIVQTAYSDDKQKAIECGCSGFISKPFDKMSLLKVIREYI